MFHSTTGLSSLDNVANAPIIKSVTVNALTAAQTIILPARSGKRFIPEAAWGRVITKDATPIVGAILRIGNNGSFNNACALLTFTTTLAVNDILYFALPVTITSIDIGTTGLSVDVQTVASGNSIADHTIKIFIRGVYE